MIAGSYTSFEESPLEKAKQYKDSKRKNAKRRQQAKSQTVHVQTPVQPGLVLPETGGSKPEVSKRNPQSAEDENPNAKTHMDDETAVQSFGKDLTTVIVRNVPNRYTSEQLVNEAIAAGFENFDFFYLPIDFNTKRNRGYAFINFYSPIIAQQFTLAFHGRQLTRYRSKKVLEIAPAATQGLQENMTKHLKKEHCRINNQWFRAMVFISEDFK
eukprot:TRINITY_DN3490_c0_g1_i3.p2 TRINITY_DN3490_c0_g1~~TRINITY_DN3490_c0_g1_i3.p2  ORF type:complete len:213 (+),score=58.99 TRINITY_DN3490_c0_g1_i3:143-781(+)